MEIKTKSILKFLEREGVSYSLSGSPREGYKIASLFNPIDNGFYFFTGNILPDSIRDSMIICHNTIKKQDQSNFVIKLEILDPQIVFYSFINSIAATQSNGRISEMNIISEKAIIGKNVQIEPYCIIEDCIIGDNTIIKSHSRINSNTVIGNNTIIDSGSIIGAEGIAWVWNKDERIRLPQLGGVQIGNNSFFGANTIVVRGSLNEDTILGDNCIFAPGCRIGHGCIIGKFVHLSNNIALGGNSRLGDYSFIGAGATLRPKVHLHKHTIVGAGAVVIKNTSDTNRTLIGVPAKEVISSKDPSAMPKPKLNLGS